MKRIARWMLSLIQSSMLYAMLSSLTRDITTMDVEIEPIGNGLYDFNVLHNEKVIYKRRGTEEEIYGELDALIQEASERLREMEGEDE